MPSLLLRLLVFCLLLLCAAPATADHRTDPREQALSDTLDLWREGRFEQLYGILSHRRSMTRERFVEQMKDTPRRPACCHLKLNDFRLISEKRTTATVFARIGMEGGPGSAASHSREFTLDHEEGRWKVRLADITALAELTGKKKKKQHAGSYHR